MWHVVCLMGDLQDGQRHRDGAVGTGDLDALFAQHMELLGASDLKDLRAFVKKNK